MGVGMKEHVPVWGDVYERRPDRPGACTHVIVCENGLCRWATSFERAKELFDTKHAGLWELSDDAGEFIANVSVPFWLTLKNKDNSKEE